MTQMIHQFRGTGVAMVTPFNAKGDVDFDKLAILTDYLITKGINYLVALGTTAETPTLSKMEKRDIVGCIIDAAGSRIPVVVGAGGNSTAEVVESIRNMHMDGVSGLLSVAPYYNKPGQEGLYRHFSAVAAVSDVPVILYNVPGRTGSNIAADTVLRLAYDFADTIIAVKEASGDFNQIMNIINGRPKNFLVVSGDDAVALPMIASGGDGVISVIGNAYPSLISMMVSAALVNAYDKARELHYKLLPMIQAIFKEGNPTGVKASLEIQGVIENVLRLPLIPSSSDLYEEIRALDRVLQKD